MISAKDRDQVFLAEIIGFHQRAEDFERGSIRYGMMLFFVRFNQSQQDFGVLLFFPRWIVFACQLVQNREVFLMLALRSDRGWRADFEAYFSGTAIILFATLSRRIQRDSETQAGFLRVRQAGQSQISLAV